MPTTVDVRMYSQSAQGYPRAGQNTSLHVEDASALCFWGRRGS